MKKSRKVFIAINLDERTKRYIDKKVDKIEVADRVVKRMDPENYHLTLFYIGFIDDQKLASVCEKIKKGLRKIRGFDICLNLLSWLPKKDNPKMLWLTGEKSEELINLKSVIENSLKGINNKESKKDFKPHINLGRIIKSLVSFNTEFNEIEEKLSVSIPVNSVEVMESVKEKGKQKHYVLERVEFL